LALHEQTPPEQVAFTPHGLPQDPQFVPLVRRSTSQPLPQLPSQLP
jgi:hypothetical protein